MHQKIKELLKNSFEIGKMKIGRQYGCFELIGCDIMIDENLKP